MQKLLLPVVAASVGLGLAKAASDSFQILGGVLPVLEPSGIALMSTGLLLVGFLAYKRRHMAPKPIRVRDTSA